MKEQLKESLQETAPLTEAEASSAGSSKASQASKASQTSQTRLALISIVVENRESATAINELLHSYGGYIIGRMGIPYPSRGISLISVAIDAPGDAIASLSGKLGAIPGVTVKTAYSKV